MPNIRRPRKGSMQFWPRVRAKRQYARIRNWKNTEKNGDAKPLGFAGYKAGMTHIIFTDGRKTSMTNGMDVSWPVTIVECPPIKTASIRFYKKTSNGFNVISEIFSQNMDKELKRKISPPKKKSETGSGKVDYDEVRLLVYTQPKLTGLEKKKPEVFEIGLGGGKESQLKYASEKLGKEITLEDVFKEGQQVDVHAVTKGKGFQGPVKRFGVSLKAHKTEKGVRRVGSLGPWCGQGHVMWRVAHAGKMGYHLRTEYNKNILKIGKNGSEINAEGGYIDYGLVKNQYLLLKGSIPGVKKRLITLTAPQRPNRKLAEEISNIKYISLKSKQGN